jgi:3-methyladenine DNA glycosylase/8-oxoguanine DNA glycosylase
MVYQPNIQTMPLIRRSHLIVRSPVAAFAAWIWFITGANVNVDLAYTMFGRV